MTRQRTGMGTSVRKTYSPRSYIGSLLPAREALHIPNSTSHAPIERDPPARNRPTNRALLVEPRIHGRPPAGLPRIETRVRRRRSHPSSSRTSPIGRRSCREDAVPTAVRHGRGRRRVRSLSYARDRFPNGGDHDRQESIRQDIRRSLLAAIREMHGRDERFGARNSPLPKLVLHVDEIPPVVDVAVDAPSGAVRHVLELPREVRGGQIVRLKRHRDGDAVEIALDGLERVDVQARRALLSRWTARIRVRIVVLLLRPLRDVG